MFKRTHFYSFLQNFDFKEQKYDFMHEIAWKALNDIKDHDMSHFYEILIWRRLIFEMLVGKVTHLLVDPVCSSPHCNYWWFPTSVLKLSFSMYNLFRSRLVLSNGSYWYILMAPHKSHAIIPSCAVQTPDIQAFPPKTIISSDLYMTVSTRSECGYFINKKLLMAPY